jgi:hypothetical protein
MDALESVVMTFYQEQMSYLANPGVVPVGLRQLDPTAGAWRTARR